MQCKDDPVLSDLVLSDLVMLDLVLSDLVLLYPILSDLVLSEPALSIFVALGMELKERKTDQTEQMDEKKKQASCSLP